jgi:hypothetical protein
MKLELHKEQIIVRMVWQPKDAEDVLYRNAMVRLEGNMKRNFLF